MNNTIFAEIEIDPVRASVMLPPQPILQRTADPIREKFYEMRKLASTRPFAKNDSELFYRQAEFMEDFADNYEGEANFNMYFPYYQKMGYDYLRTYFTWRTKVRNGEMQTTSLSYIFLYIYELLSGIGTENSIDGLNKLMAVWDEFSKQYSAIETHLPKWLKDYHVFYELPHSFSEFVEEYGMQKHYSLTLLFDSEITGQLALWNCISSYDVHKSKYYNAGNEEIFSKCFDAALSEIQSFCIKRNIDLGDLLVYSVSRRSPWQPFKSALFGSKYRQSEREVHISKYERYYCKNGEWTANLPIYYSSQKDFVGYIIKKTEACLRQASGYKHRLVAEIRPGSKPFRELQRGASNRAELDRVIEKATVDFYKDINRTVVTVDHESLARIREEALETQGQLTVEETAITTAAEAMQTPAEETAQTQTAPELFASAATEGCPLPIESGDEKITLSFADGWKALKSALIDKEKEALSIVLKNHASQDYRGIAIKTFADEMNIMLEVLVDGINEKASDFIGDSILEFIADEMSQEALIIYDEYITNVMDLVR